MAQAFGASLFEAQGSSCSGVRADRPEAAGGRHRRIVCGGAQHADPNLHDDDDEDIVTCDDCGCF